MTVLEQLPFKMKLNSISVMILVIFVMTSCSDMKNTEYGKLIFKTEFDGLLHTDQLWLYDNGTFRIDMPDLEANGTFIIQGDTIFLNYFIFTGNHSQAFVIENKFVFELANKENRWIRSERDSYMAINKNELSAF